MVKEHPAFYADSGVQGWGISGSVRGIIVLKKWQGSFGLSRASFVSDNQLTCQVKSGFVKP